MLPFLVILNFVGSPKLSRSVISTAPLAMSSLNAGVAMSVRTSVLVVISGSFDHGPGYGGLEDLIAAGLASDLLCS